MPPPPVAPWHQRPVAPWPPVKPHLRPPPGGGADTAAHDRRIRGLLIGAGALAIVMSVAVIIRSAIQLGDGGRVLDVSRVQAGVAQILSDPVGGYGANTVGDVSCNHGRNPSARKGTSFVCDVAVNGAQRHVTVVVTDDAGTYEVDRPR
ncbi:DUF4333 domain-containing protein [Mycobacterium sp.]|uniref:DUF4333 domain-containing protein n=1 Tax=Mycobacterium sp. TaxID=1785 RepID=UPI003D107F25